MVVVLWTQSPTEVDAIATESEPNKMPSNPSSDIDSAGASSSTTKKKKSGLSLSALKSPFKFLGKTYCRGCKKKCTGEVLRVNDVYFHITCFKCKGCKNSLSQGGFFTKDKDYYCAACYQSSYGTKCAKCSTFVEGEVVTALGKTYHQKCFTCAGCNKPFPTGERVTFTGKTCLCQQCVGAAGVAEENGPVNGSAGKTELPTLSKSTAVTAACPEDICAGCGQELKDGQALMALDKQYHVWCFKCKACDSLLHGEYMGKDGFPYCEKDYQLQFGVKCTYCFRFISGKVLQAGENNHFHPTCARCTKCGEPFGDGEEMFLQGAAIWHPRCGPGPDDSGYIVNGFETSREPDTASMTVSEHPPYGSRASSPGASLRRDYGQHSDRFSRSTMHIGGGFSPNLYSSSSTYSLRRPLEPGDRSGSNAHLTQFHLPPSRRSSRGAAYSSRQSMDNIVAGGFRPVSAPPKPGYTLRSSTLPSPGRNGVSPGPWDYAGSRSDVISQQSFRTDFTDLRQSATFGGFGRGSHVPQPVITDYKTYPLHLLFTTNYKLPPDIDRCNLEKHLNDADFQMAFMMTQDEFYQMPKWRQNDMKRRVRLF